MKVPYSYYQCSFGYVELPINLDLFHAACFMASLAQCEEFWEHMSQEDFIRDLDLSEPSTTVPIAIHVDGVKIFKNQKAWIYSYSSMTRKAGDSICNKMVILILRDSLLAKYT